MATINEIAAIIHADMCNDESNGYSWAPRWGGDAGWEKTLTIDGYDYTYPVGSYDCSSSTKTAWQLAIQYTDYAGALDGATYTGDMRSVFVNSGLFEVWSPGVSDSPGDLYLNDGSHVAMSQGDGLLSEFSGNEFGGVYGGQVGDQTGWESHIQGYYNYPWSCTLHYNGKADDSFAGSSERKRIEAEKELQRKDAQPWTAPIEGGNVYRCYNPSTGDHMYTTSEIEKDTLLKNGWLDEGIAWKSPKTGQGVFRFYNPSNGDHMYTTDFEEVTSMINQGWIFEGVNFVSNGSRAVYRIYNPYATRGTHMFTKNSTENNMLRQAGWTYEGIAFYTE